MESVSKTPEKRESISKVPGKKVEASKPDAATASTDIKKPSGMDRKQESPKTPATGAGQKADAPGKDTKKDPVGKPKPEDAKQALQKSSSAAEGRPKRKDGHGVKDKGVRTDGWCGSGSLVCVLLACP